MMRVLCAAVLCVLMSVPAQAQEEKDWGDIFPTREWYCMPGVGQCLDDCYENPGDDTWNQICYGACVEEWCWQVGPEMEEVPEDKRSQVKPLSSFQALAALAPDCSREQGVHHRACIICEQGGGTWGYGSNTCYYDDQLGGDQLAGVLSLSCSTPYEE